MNSTLDFRKRNCHLKFVQTQLPFEISANAIAKIDCQFIYFSVQMTVHSYTWSVIRLFALTYAVSCTIIITYHLLAKYFSYPHQFEHCINTGMILESKCLNNSHLQKIYFRLILWNVQSVERRRRPREPSIPTPT